MVGLNALLYLLALTVLEVLANPIAIQRSSLNSVEVPPFGNLQVHHTPSGTSRAISLPSSTSPHYQPTIPPSKPASTVAFNTTRCTSTATAKASVSLQGTSVPSFDTSKPFAIAYSPYASSGGCKDVSAISKDLQTIAAAGYQSIRLYGTDCNQVLNVLFSIKSTGIGLKLFLGVYDLDKASSETSSIIAAVGGQWSNIATISVGNEPVNQGQASVSTVVDTTHSVRSQLRAAGYQGPVVAVDTFIAILNNPGLCDASDYIAANAHPYFDGGVSASGAGAWVALQASKLSSLCGGKDVLITESGWPSAGETNGQAVASEANQAIAMAGILSSMRNKCVVFTAFDDLWKSPGDFGVEQHWGVL